MPANIYLNNEWPIVPTSGQAENIPNDPRQLRYKTISKWKYELRLKTEINCKMLL